MWGQEANLVANESCWVHQRGVSIEKIPQRTEVQETEKRKLNVLQSYKENQKELEKCTTSIVCVGYESDLQLK